jgi:hypothetical protein
MHGIRILVGGGEMEKYKTMLGGDAGESLMLRMLKRRDLNPVFSSEELASESASGGRVAGFVVENVPDFFVSSSAGAPGSANYKGTTIISTGVQGVLWVAGLSTREVNKFNLQ